MLRDRLWRAARLLPLLTLAALTFSAQLYVGYRADATRVPFLAIFFLQICHWYLWAIAGPLVWELASRWRLGMPRRKSHLVRHALAAVGVALAVITSYVVITQAVGRLPLLRPWLGGNSRSFLSTAVFIFTWYFHIELLVYATIVVFADAAAATREAATARLQALRAQLQPHFLFNTLHTIGSLVMQRDNDRAVQMIAEFGDLLRATLDQPDADAVPLDSELSYLRRYVRIEEARFGDRLRVEWRVAGDAATVPVPPFILQPIVENAFRHGIARQSGPARLVIAARLEGSVLEVSVYNDGPLLPAAWSLAASGVGLSNVVERLRARGPASGFTLANAGTSGVVATVTLQGT